MYGGASSRFLSVFWDQPAGPTYIVSKKNRPKRRTIQNQAVNSAKPWGVQAGCGLSFAIPPSAACRDGPILSSRSDFNDFAGRDKFTVCSEVFSTKAGQNL